MNPGGGGSLWTIPSAMRNQVEVEGPGRVGCPVRAAERLLDTAKGRQRLARPEARLDKGQTVEVLRQARVGPGRRSPP